MEISDHTTNSFHLSLVQNTKTFHSFLQTPKPDAVSVCKPFKDEVPGQLLRSTKYEKAISIKFPLIALP